MGCTRNFTAKDYLQASNSLGRSVAVEQSKPLTKEQRDAVREALNKTASEKIVEILSNPNSPARSILVRQLLCTVNSKDMTEDEKRQLPEAYKIILERQSDPMGLFSRVSAHRAPGSSPAQHHYEISATAALMKKSFATVNGKNLSISTSDRVDFGMKVAAGHTQPKRYGTIEADLMIAQKVSKKSLFSERTVGIDYKFARTGDYAADPGRQLEGIRKGFLDGKLDEFIYVTNGKFANNFSEQVREKNIEIAKDFVERINRAQHEYDRQDLTDIEKQNIPDEKIKSSIFADENKEQLKKLIDLYNIPQIDICQHVNFLGTD